MRVAVSMVYCTVLELTKHISSFYIVTVGEVIATTGREVYDVVRITVHPILEPTSSLINHVGIETRFAVRIHIVNVFVYLGGFVCGVVAAVFHFTESSFIVSTIVVIDCQSIGHEEHIHCVLGRSNGSVTGVHITWVGTLFHFILIGIAIVRTAPKNFLIVFLKKVVHRTVWSFHPVCHYTVESMVMCFSIIYQVFYTVSGNNPFLRVFALGEDVFSFSILEFLQSLVVFRAITTIEKLGGGIHPQLGTQGLSHYDGGAYYFMEVITIVSIGKRGDS